MTAVSILFAIGMWRVVASDALQYPKIVEVFRGQATFDDVWAPFRNRVLVPFLASILPFDPKSSIQFVNLFFAFGTVIIFVRYLRSFRFNQENTLFGAMLLMCTVPYFAYGPQPLSEMGAMFFIVLSLYLTKKGTSLAFIMVVISLGILCRETVFFVLPAILIISYRGKNNGSRWGYLAAILPFVTILGIRFLISQAIASGDGSSPIGYVWSIDPNYIQLNLGRLVNFVDPVSQGLSGGSFWLSFVPFAPFALTRILAPHKQSEITKNERGFLLTSGLFLFLLTIYCFVAAGIDGRNVWVLYPALIPLSMAEYANWSEIRVFRSIKIYLDKMLQYLAVGRGSKQTE